MKKQSRNPPASALQSTQKAPSSKMSSQRCDKQRHRSSKQFDSRHASDKQQKSGIVVNSEVYVNHSLALQSQSRDKLPPKAMANPVGHRNNRHKEYHRRASAAQPSVSSKRTPDFVAPKLASRPKTTDGRGMYRAEGMFDLSNLHLNPEHRGSVYNLLEEFKKQVLIPEATSVSKNKMEYSRSQHKPPTLIDDESLCNGRSNPTTSSSKSVSSTQPKIVQRNNSRPKMDMQDTRSSGSLSRSRDSSRVTTDSEEELLAQILLSMSRSSSSHQQLEDDESDYVNLWDSESGTSSYQTNKDIMGSLMRNKFSRQTSLRDDRRNAWLSTSQSSESSTAEATSDELHHFDMNKFKSLQEKAENMDLTLTDFFTDLKHSNSILELSKFFPSTQQLSPNDCKFKCHPGCEDDITDQCCGPRVDKSLQDSDRWSDCKVRHHDVDDADSGYSGSGGSAGFTLTKEEICSKIQAYNRSVGLSSGAMTLPSNDSDSFQGCIKVCICIARPINMSLSSRPTSIYEALHRESELSPQASPVNTMVTHEKLPENAVVSLHTDSCNTAIEVVSILLNKFKITDNPKSFALFEQTIQNEKEVKLRKVGDQERPLLNYLRWITEHNESKRFVLKENDSGDIMYEAFSIPELNNFLRVLEQEEAVRLTEIQNKYQVRRKQLADRLCELAPLRNPHKAPLQTAR